MCNTEHPPRGSFCTRQICIRESNRTDFVDTKMADSSTLDSAAKDQFSQLEITFSNVVPTYVEYIEYSNHDNRIKWPGNYELLRNFVSDLFGNDGKWSSPGGSGKSFRNDRLCITWYANKESLLFQPELGDKLKDLVVNLCKSKAQIHEFEAKENAVVDRLLQEIADVKINAHQMSAQCFHYEFLNILRFVSKFP